MEAGRKAGLGPEQLLDRALLLLARQHRDQDKNWPWGAVQGTGAEGVARATALLPGEPQVAEFPPSPSRPGTTIEQGRQVGQKRWG